MSIVFVPKIAYSFEAIKSVNPTIIVVQPLSETALREYNSWSVKELTIMVNLRAIGLSYRSIARHIHRSHDACALAFHRNDLTEIYQGIRAELVAEVLRYGK